MNATDKRAPGKISTARNINFNPSKNESVSDFEGGGDSHRSEKFMKTSTGKTTKLST